MKHLTPILALALAACGGGGEPAAEALEASCTVSILLNGDSTNWGYEPGGEGARAVVYPELALQRAMDERFGAGRVLVRTGAVSGSTSTDAIGQPRNADIVVYNSGINDVAYGHGESQYWTSMRALAKVPGVVFQTPLPVAGAGSYESIMRAVAAEAGVPVIEARTGADWAAFQDDGVHPNAAGYEVLGRDVLAPALAPMVQELCP